MKTIRGKLLTIILSIVLIFGLIVVCTSMIQLTGLSDKIVALGQKQASDITVETTNTMAEHEYEVAADFADASVKYFNQVFSDVHKHTLSIANKAGELYAKDEHVATLDSQVGIVKGVDPASVEDDFSVIAPIRDFIAFLPNYDIEHLEKLDLYVVTESGMCLDGTYAELGNEYADLRNEIWYTTVKENNELYWSGVFTGKVTGKVKVVCAAPFYDAEGNLKGVASGDIAVETFQNILEDYNENQILSVVFFDKDGELMYATNGYDDFEEVQKNLNGSSDIVENDGFIYTYRTMDETGWTIALVLSEEKINNAVATVQSNIEQNAQSTNQLVKEGIKSSLATCTIAIIVGLLIAVLLTSYLSRKFAKPIIELTDEVAAFGEGNLDAAISVSSNDEIGKLAEAFNKMTVDLKEYMNNLQKVTAEKERIGAELDVATHIQSSMLPCIFPPYPDRKEFDIYASMDPAKEVGGDFYDFFMVDNTHIAIVMADVSGKGVPAALFMVIGKTLIKDHTVPGSDLTEVFAEVNNILCDSNSEGLFITAFEGVLNLETGEFLYVNAGHETPFIYHKGGQFEQYPMKPGFVLAGMEDMKFKGGSIMLQPGDKIFTYTDGVPEATDASNELYGMERLDAIMKQVGNEEPREILRRVREDVDAFVGDAPQFDDLTMLCLQFNERM